MLPDIDHHNSTITNRSGVIGKVISKTSKHRGFWHSWVPLTALWFGAFKLNTMQDEVFGIYTMVIIAIAAINTLVVFGKNAGFIKGHVGKVEISIFAISISLLVAIFAKGLPIAYTLSSLSFGVFVGYLSHILADMLNPDGVQLLWPIPTHIKFPIVQISTGKTLESLFLMMTILLNCYFAYNIIKGM